MFWAFKLSFDVDILAFLTWQLFGLFFEKFGNFFLIVWSLCWQTLSSVASDGGTVVEHLTRVPKIEGSHPEAATGERK